MRLRVLSLNVWGLPSPAGHLVEERLERIAADLPAAEADLVLFQEVWTDAGRERLQAGGPGAGLPYAWSPPGPAQGSGGLLALSRHPIRDPGFRPYRLCGLPQRFTQMDYYSGKGIGRFDVEVAGARVTVLNTHMHARYSPARVRDEYVGHRAAEVIELADELRGITTPVVLAGDLNMRDVAPEYRLLKGMTGLVDAAMVLDAREPTSTLDNAFRAARGAKTESRIDYVMSRAGLDRGVQPISVRLAFDDRFSLNGAPASHSDHAGVLAELEVGGPGQPPPVVRGSAILLGRLLLEGGRERARRRRLVERIGAGVGVGTAVGAAVAARRVEVTRRRFLRVALAGCASLATASTAGLLALSEHFVPEELAEFDRIESLLGEIEAAEARREAPPRPASISLR